jgi:hypothetical protein
LVVALALVLMVLTGTALTWRYRPGGAGSSTDLVPAIRWSRRLVGGHEASLIVALPALLLWGGLTFKDAARRARHRAAVACSGLGALALVVLTAVAWQRAHYEQLGLWAVTVDGGTGGLWYAAFSDEVRFVFVDGLGDMSPSEVAPWVILHLVAPVVALVMFAGGWLAGQPPRQARRSIVAPPTDVRSATE